MVLAARHARIALVVLLLTAARAAAATWRTASMGGGGALNSPVIRGRFRAIGSDLGGVYLSANNGKSYVPIGSQRGLAATHVSAMAFSAWNKIIVGTDDGLFLLNAARKRATRTWQDGFGRYVGAVASSPGDQSVAYAAVHPSYDANSPYLLRSTNGGSSWVYVADLPRSLRILALRPHPVDVDGIWAVSGEARFATGPAEAYFSVNAGETWVRRDPAPSGSELVDIEYTYDPRQLNRMLATTRSGAKAALYESMETGFSWTKLSSSITGVILPDRTMSAHWRVLEQVYNSASWVIHESFNSGASWTSAEVEPLGEHWSESVNVWGISYSFQGLLQTLGHNPLMPDQVFWTNPQFVWASADYGRTCRNIVSKKVSKDRWITRGIDNIVPAVIAPSPVRGKTVYVGLLDMGLFRTDNAGKSWEQLNDEEFSEVWLGFGGNTFTVLPDPVRKKTVWAHLGGEIGGPAPIHLVRSNNKGQKGTWQELRSGLPDFLYQLGGLSADPASFSNPMRTLYVTANDNVYKSVDDGDSWELVLYCNQCHLTFSFTASTVFAGGNGGLWRSTTGGSAGSWQATSGFPNLDNWSTDVPWTGWAFAGLSDLCAGPGQTIWAAVTGDGFYRSVDGGLSFRRVRQDRYARTVAYDSKRGHLYVGSSSASIAGGYDESSNGVYLSTDNGATFEEFNGGLAYKFATQIRVAKNGVVWAVSPGQGIVRTT